MTPECQPLDISVNKIFKDHIKYKFELNRINLDKINGKMKLKTARLHMIENVYNSWADDNIITKDIIIHGFNRSGNINNYYLSYEEEKINKNYLYDLFEFSNLDILDDFGADLNLDINELNENSESGDEKNINVINNLEKDFSKEVLDAKDIELKEINDLNSNDKMDLDS